MADAIYGGATIEATQNDMVRQLQSTMKGYQRQLFHDGVYAVVTLMANDDSQRENPGQEDGEEGTLEKTEQPRIPISSLSQPMIRRAICSRDMKSAVRIM